MTRPAESPEFRRGYDRGHTDVVPARTVAALFVDHRGPYVSMPGVDAWPISRDAKTYTGSDPVVCHPDCGPWSKLRHLCTRQDEECGPIAVDIVRRNGGVLEHPAHSALFDYCGLPKPGEFADAYGGSTYYVEQVWWAHPCVKPTWLYLVGIEHQVIGSGLLEALRSERRPTHCVCTGPRQLKRLPVAFAEWLIALARASEVR